MLDHKIRRKSVWDILQCTHKQKMANEYLEKKFDKKAWTTDLMSVSVLSILLQL